MEKKEIISKASLCCKLSTLWVEPLEKNKHQKHHNLPEHTPASPIPNSWIEKKLAPIF